VLVGEAAPRLGREGKGITSNMINSSPYQSSPAGGILSRWSSDGGLISRAFVPHPAGPLLSLSLKVEHLKVLRVEHLKVMVYLLGWGVNSRACLRILDSRVY
jgi:hypothetical protein